MKAAIFIDRVDNSGGQVRVVANLCHAWVQSGWEVHLITTDQHECSYPLPSSVIRHKLLSHPRRRGVMRIWDNFLITLGLRKVANHEKLNGILAISAVESILLALARCPSSVIKLGSEHVYARHYPMPTLLGLCRRFVYPTLDGVVCPASQATRALREDCPQVNAINIPNLLVWPSLVSSDSSAPRLSRERRRFVSCGRLVFDKGFEDVIEAFSRVAVQFSEWDLVIIGDGPAEEALKVEAAVAPVIARADIVSRSNMPIWLATSNIVGACMIFGLRSSGALLRSSSCAITACVVARLPAVSNVMNRSPGTSQWNILRKVETLSTPELVRLSDMNAMPLSSIIPTQYVITLAVPRPYFYYAYCSTRKLTTMLSSCAPKDRPVMGAASE